MSNPVFYIKIASKRAELFPSASKRMDEALSWVAYSANISFKPVCTPASMKASSEIRLLL